MKVYQAINEVSKAMSAAGIGKDKRNQGQGYNFRGIDDVLNALCAALTRAGLVILPRVTERECVERQTSKGGALFYVTVRVEFDLVSVEDGSKHTVMTFGEAMDSADKATNKAMSAAYKYLALLTFCIPTEPSPETDADYTTHDVAPAADQRMAPEAIADWLAYIDGQETVDELRSGLVIACDKAKEHGDKDAYAAFRAAGMKRHKELEKTK